MLAVNVPYRFNVKIFVAFGTGNSFRCIESHQLAQKLGPEKCVATLLFHSFTRCDTTTSFFSRRGKMSAWTVWDLFNDLTRVFCALPMNPESIHTEMPVLERFVVLLYHKTSSKLEVNESHFELFSAMTDRLTPYHQQQHHWSNMQRELCFRQISVIRLIGRKRMN